MMKGRIQQIKIIEVIESRDLDQKVNEWIKDNPDYHVGKIETRMMGYPPVWWAAVIHYWILAEVPDNTATNLHECPVSGYPPHETQHHIVVNPHFFEKAARGYLTQIRDRGIRFNMGDMIALHEENGKQILWVKCLAVYEGLIKFNALSLEKQLSEDS